MNGHDRKQSEPPQILVVDDTPASLNLLTEILTGRGYQVRSASSGRLALRSAAIEAPDLILLDVRMPDMNGYEVCRRLKEDPGLKEVPVIFISALDATDDKVKGFNAGCVDYIVKPFQSVEILARVETHLAMQRLRVQLEAQNIQLQKLNDRLEQKVGERTAQLQEAQEELVRKEKLSILGQLSGSVGHELRNPLGVMSNAVYFLKTVMTDADETVTEYLGIIESEIDNSQRIITDLLDFARTKPPRTKTISASELIDENLGKCAVPENVAVAVELPESLPPLTVDPLQMGQVLQNLVCNAVQAMPEGGALRIAARLVGAGLVPAHDPKGQPQGLPLWDGIEISVADTGQGISPENMKKLFQPLFTTKPKGVGLGLVVCRNLVEANGGRIGVESEQGVGTTFTVALPVGSDPGDAAKEG
jgi:signal transduction histidine kinase